VDFDALAILMDCCELDLWPPKCNQVISGS